MSAISSQNAIDSGNSGFQARGDFAGNFSQLRVVGLARGKRGWTVRPAAAASSRATARSSRAMAASSWSISAACRVVVDAEPAV